MTLLQPSKAPWLREEALAEIIDVAFVSKAASELMAHGGGGVMGSRKPTAVATSTVIPSFQVRLEQQKEAFLDTLSPLLGASKDSVAESKAVVGRDGQDAFKRHKFGLDKVSH